MSIAVEKPIHKRYRKYGETAHLLEPVFQDTRQNGQQRAVRVALLLIAQPTDGSPPSQTLLRQAALIEEAALDSPKFVRDTLFTWLVWIFWCVLFSAAQILRFPRSITEFVSKTSEYALLLGLLRARASTPGSMADRTFPQTVIDGVVENVVAGLSSGDMVKAKLMLRFLGECVDASAVAADDVLHFCTQVLTSAQACGRGAVAILAAHAVGMMLVWCGQLLKPSSAEFQTLLQCVTKISTAALSTSMPGISNTLSPLTPTLAQWSEQDISGEVPGGSSPLGAARLALVEMLHALESLDQASWSGDATAPVDRLTPRLQDALHGSAAGGPPPHP